ncbi:MAG: hypothetical protein ACTHOE_16290 [Conexibacter sp.]
MRGGLTRGGSVALLGACCAFALPLAGCGSGGASNSSASEEAAPPATTQTLSAAEQARAEARRDRLERLKLERTFAPNPWREPGNGPPHPHGRITHVSIRDVKRGRGPALRGDETVYVNYVMTFWKSGKVFNHAWGPLRFEYFSLPQDASDIHRAIVGMRPGGRRVILLPAAVSQAHLPNGGGGYVDSRVDLVLRKILPSG